MARASGVAVPHAVVGPGTMPNTSTMAPQSEGLRGPGGSGKGGTARTGHTVLVADMPEWFRCSHGQDGAGHGRKYRHMLT